MKALPNVLPGNRRKYFVAMALSLFLTAGFSYAGNVANTRTTLSNLGATSHPTMEWVLDKTVSNVDFYHAVSTCNGKNTVFLKFVNRNTGSVKVGWKEIFVTTDRQRKEGFTGRKEMVIPAGTTTSPDCERNANKKIVIKGSEVDPMSVLEIVNFIYKDITVSEVL